MSGIVRSAWNYCQTVLETYAAASTGDPAPVVEFSAQIRDHVGGVFGVRGLDQVVVVILRVLGHGAKR